jgi:hypothetical protein
MWAGAVLSPFPSPGRRTMDWQPESDMLPAFLEGARRRQPLAILCEWPATERRPADESDKGMVISQGCAPG